MSYSSEVLADAPLLWWRLGEASGTTAADSSGNSRNGTYAGSPTLGAASLLDTDANTAVSFDAVDDKVSIAHATWMNGSFMSVEMWLKPASLAAEQAVAGQWGASSSTQRWMVLLQTDGRVRFVSRNSVNTFHDYITPGPGPITTGTRWHVVVTFSDTDDYKRIYVNGSLIGSVQVAAAGTQLGSQTAPIELGKIASGGQYQGVVDEFAFYGTTLSDARILAHYEAGVSAGGAAVTGDVAATLPALSAQASGTVALPPTTGSVSATLPALSASVDGTVASPVAASGSVDATLPALTASVAGDVAAPAGAVTGTVGATLPALSASAAGEVGDAAESIGFGFGFGMRVTDRRTQTADPRTNLPQYRLVAVDMYGNQLAELDRATIGPIEDEVNGAGGFTFTVGSRDPKARNVMPRHGAAPPEVQVWRGDQLIAWCAVKTIRTGGMGLYTFDCVGLRYYYSRRFIDRRPRRTLFRNGTFGSGLMWWDSATASGTITASVVASDRGIDGKAVRLTDAGTNVVGASGPTARHLRQRRRITQPVALQAPLPIRATLDMRVETFTAASLLGYSVKLIAVSTADLATIVDTDEVEMSESYLIDADTPRDRWHEVTLEVEVPANGVEHIVELRLVPPGAGVAEFTNIDVSPAEQLAYFDDDQAWIVGNLSDNAQDPQWGKGTLNIGRHTPLTGVLRTREYEFADHRPYLDAMNEYPALAHGVEWDIATTGTTRTLTTFYPRQGSASDVVLALGANVVDYDATVDLDNTANSVVVQGLTLGGSDRKERHALDAGSMGGAILEGVIMADEETPLPELDEAARQALVEMGSPAPTLRVTCHPRHTSDLLDRLDKGDTCRTIISDGLLDEDGTARAMRRTLDPNTDGLTYDLVWEA